MHTKKVQQLQVLIHAHHTTLNSRNITAALVKLTALTERPVGSASEDGSLVEDVAVSLVHQLADKYRSLSAPEVAQVVHCLVKLPVRNVPGWVPDALKDHQQGLYACNEAELSQLLWALVKLSISAPSQEWVLHAASVGMGRLHNFNARQLSSFGWALYKLGHTPTPQWLSQYSVAVRHWLNPHAPSHAPSHVTLMVWVLSAWQYTFTDGWLQDLYRYCTAHWRHMNWLSLTQLMKALADMRIIPPAAWVQECCVTAKQFFHVSTPRTDVQFLTALARFKHKVDPAIMADLLQFMQPRLCTFSPQQLGRLMWALTQLRYMPSQQYIQVLLEQVGACSSLLCPAGVCSLLLALRQWQLLPPQEYMTRVLQSTTRALPQFTTQQLVLVTVCLRQLRVRVPPSWMRKLLEEVVARHAEVQPGQLARVVFALHRLLSPQVPFTLPFNAKHCLLSPKVPVTLPFNAKHCLLSPKVPVTLPFNVEHRLLSPKDVQALQSVLSRIGVFAASLLEWYNPDDLMLLFVGFIRIGYWPGHRFLGAATNRVAEMEMDLNATSLHSELQMALNDLKKLNGVESAADME